MTRRDMYAEARAAYEAWCANPDAPELPPWDELTSAEHDAWLRAVRLIAVLGWEEA